jgi:hypothetical protein
VTVTDKINKLKKHVATLAPHLPMMSLPSEYQQIGRPPFIGHRVLLGSDLPFLVA